MNEEQSNFESLISPDLPEQFSTGESSLVEKAAETAKSQSEIRDFLSATVGNLFAFFAILFPPIIAKVVDMQVAISGDDEQESESQD